MYSKKEKDLIVKFNKENNIIGEVDIYYWELNSFETLYYFYPLMERLIINILSIEGREKIEIQDSQRMKTLNEILKDNMIISEYVTDKLKCIYNEEGNRNKLLHGDMFKNNINIIKHIYEVRWITSLLMEEYMKKIS